MKINLYAPVDCDILDITQSTDEVFASKTLGDGLVVIPKSGKFKSPLDDATIKLIFDTKHAFYFSQSDCNFLLHIGLDTVKLEGKPFEVLCKLDEKISKKSDIVNVDLEYIHENNLSIETILTVESKEGFEYKINILKNTAKQGEKIAEVEITLNKEISKNNDLTISEFKNKYAITAEQIYAQLGGNQNFGSVFNCMTRFRTEVVDKNKINLEEIKKINLVKGAQFQGQQLQIIIGGEVVKVVEEFKNKYNNAKNDISTKVISEQNVNIGKRILTTITGVISPLLGIFIAAGLFAGVYSILLELKAVQSIPDLMNIAEYDLFSAIMFLLFKFILSSIGLFFMISTVKYFDGNIYFALAVGLALISRGFAPIIEGASIEEAEFGKWISYSGKTGFLLFNIGSIPIVIGGYEGAVLPFIGAAAMVILLDKWIASWISPLVDTIFRGFIVVALTLLGTWVLFGPILGLVEYGLLSFFTWTEKIPFGIGVGLYALFWQPLVLTGAHIAVSTPVDISLYAGNASILYPAYNIAIFTQMGAVIGVIIVTKNYTFKRIAGSSIIGGFFGISEPIIYGVTLPKFTPFVVGCVVSFPIGIISGIIGLDLDTPGGWGVFEIVGYDNSLEKALIILMWIISLVAGCFVTMLFYKERKKEYGYARHAINKLIWQISLPTGAISKESIKTQFVPCLDKLKTLKADYKNYEKYLSTISKLETNLLMIENKENNQKERMFKRLEKLKSKLDSRDSQNLKVRFFELNLRFNNYNLENQKNIVKAKIKQCEKEHHQFTMELENQKNIILNDFLQNIEKIENFKIIENKQPVKNMIYNAIYSVEIAYEIIDQKTINFIKEKNYVKKKAN